MNDLWKVASFLIQVDLFSALRIWKGERKKNSFALFQINHLTKWWWNEYICRLLSIYWTFQEIEENNCFSIDCTNISTKTHSFTVFTLFISVNNSTKMINDKFHFLSFCSNIGHLINGFVDGCDACCETIERTRQRERERVRKE